MGGFDFSFPLLLLGAIFGIGYGLLGIGLVLAYRSSGLINFAHGAVGLVSAAMMSVVVTGYGVPYWIGFFGALVVSAAISAGIESVVVQRLAGAPKVLAMIATLGTAQALLLLALSFSRGGLGGGTFPQPPFFPEFELSAFISSSATALMILSPFAVAALYYVLQHTRYGLAIRAAAANPDAATLSGVDPRSMAMLSWALAGALSAFAAILLIPNQSTVTAESLGPDFIIRGLAVATLARFANLPLALVIGVALGIVEQLVGTNPDAVGYFEVILFLAVVVGVAVAVRQPREEQERWHRLSGPTALPVAYQQVWLIRNLGWVVGLLGFVAAALLPVWISNESAFILSTVLALAIVGMSVSSLTGLAGQLSLGQVAFAAIGAVAAVRLGTATGSVVVGLIAGGLAGAVVSTAVGLPALRVRGLQLAVATLAFALATSNWLLRQDWALGSGRNSRPIRLVGIELVVASAFYYVALAVFGLVLLMTGLVRRSSFGWSLQAVRDNEDAARVFRIGPRRITLLAYAYSGLVAGLGGAVLGFANTFVTRALFTPTESINVVAIAVIGGLTELSGPLLGALYLLAIPRFYDLELPALAGLNAAWLILILEQPRGLSGLLASTRDHLIDQLARRHGIDPATARSERSVVGEPWSMTVVEPAASIGSATATDGAASDRQPGANAPLLTVDRVSKSFGSVVAVHDVSLTVSEGETLGLIGPNGAGKTTLFELIAGFVPLDSGTVRFDGTDISDEWPEQRSSRGLVRSFQNATLFPTMTVREVLTLAHQRSTGSHHRSGRDQANGVLEAYRLMPLAEQRLDSLSTGTRRIVELAANVALGPRLLLLDEPSAGIAQADTEALVAVIEQIRYRLGITLVIIEHDMPLLTAVCNRMIALEVGSIIAEGTPAEVQRSEAVVRSYLGDDPMATARSGSANAEPSNPD